MRRRNNNKEGEQGDDAQSQQPLVDAEDKPKPEQLSLADEIRARTRAHKLGHRYPSQIADGGGFSCGPFNRFDLVVFVFLFFLLWAVVKAEYRIDLADALWDKIKPDYDEGHFDL